MDRQDIDALLVGALYGELTPADEARLAAHLESHPTDRGVLDDLKSARLAVRESRIFDLQLDPPQSVSALLLQEAHRRAPKRGASEDQKESWFFRFTKMFLAHPAMAAAAMLVLVVGVAGTLYLRKGDQFVNKEVAQETLPAGQATVVATPPADELAKNADEPAKNDGADTGVYRGGEGAAGSAYNVQLDDKNVRDQQAQQAEVAKLKAQQNALERQNNQKKSAIVVDTPRPEPKELDEQPRAKSAPAKIATASKAPAANKSAASDRYDSSDNGVLGGDSAGIAGGGGVATGSTGRVATTSPSGGASGPRNAPAPAAPPPPPPPAAAAPAPTTVAQGTAKPTAPKTTAPAPQKPSAVKEAEKAEAPAEAKQEAAPAKDSALIAWAKSEHSRALQLASKGDCSGAAKAAVLISNRAPDYYSQFVSTDRGLKKCQAYIAAERDADAERSGKARAQKRTNADEPAPAH